VQYLGYAATVKSVGYMKLPKEPLMTKRYYQAHASKLVERRRASIESSLSMTSTQNVYIYVAFGVIATCSVILFIQVSFFAAAVGAGASTIVSIPVFLLISGHPPEYGRWEVSCNRGRFVRGDTITFRCARIVDGEIVEETRMG